ncbi:MAG: c-type cytochrome [Candidatus Omnitrophica bacterium]|nr:c-type cytochrome [Candidatus Omnitrophota bacterium]
MQQKKNYVFCLMTLVFIAITVAVSNKAFPANVPAESQIPAFGMSHEEAVLIKGKKSYDTYCIGCHGVKGDGKGVAASFLNPKPRNFMLAEFRNSTRPSGSLPTDQDLYNSIANGLHGTSMPTWRLLPESERWALVAYIKTFAPDRWKEEGERISTPIPEDPFAGRREEGIKKGEIAYHGIAACYSCHPSYWSPQKINEARATYQMPPIAGLRQNIALSEAKPDSEGNPITPPDFTWDTLKRGTELETLYQAIANGISGTAMPTWKGILSEEDLWGMAYYVQSLTEQRKKFVTNDDLKQREDHIKKMEDESVRFAKDETARLEKEERDAAQKKAQVETGTKPTADQATLTEGNKI